MEGLEVSTEVRLPPGEVYEFLVDFPRYADYSKHLRTVRQDGDGGPGTAYELEFAWWKLSYTARSEVTGVDPPHSIDWRVTKDLHAKGQWAIEPFGDAERDGRGATDEDRTGDDDARPSASRVFFRVWYDADSVDGGAIDLPALVSLDWVIDKVRPKVVAEAERVVRRVVADLEGQPREIDLDVRRYDAPEEAPERT